MCKTIRQYLTYSLSWKWNTRFSQIESCRNKNICWLTKGSLWGHICVEMCWHKGFFSLQSYLSSPPHFHSFGPLQKITTITVTVNRLWVFCVLCHLHKWFIFDLAWAQPNPSNSFALPCCTCAPSSSNIFAWQWMKLYSTLRLCFCVISP